MDWCYRDCANQCVSARILNNCCERECSTNCGCCNNCCMNNCGCNYNESQTNSCVSYEEHC